MNLVCPDCGAGYRVDENKISDLSVKVRCRKCEIVFVVGENIRAEGGEGKQQGPAVSSGHILVCDDAPFFRTMLKDILTGAGYDVQTASCGEEALSSIAGSPPALLILDIQMPGMDGFEVIRQVRNGDAVPNLPILAVSAVHTDSSDMIELEDAGANDYIGKQFKPEHLLKRVQGLVGPAARGG